MSSLTCTNPPCRRSVPVPAGATPGVSYACPHCGKALPPVPNKSAEDGFYRAGVFLLIAGALMLLSSFILDTTTAGSYLLTEHAADLQRVANRICLAIAGACACLVGAVFLARPASK